MKQITANEIRATHLAAMAKLLVLNTVYIDINQYISWNDVSGRKWPQITLITKNHDHSRAIEFQCVCIFSINRNMQ